MKTILPQAFLSFWIFLSSPPVLAANVWVIEPGREREVVGLFSPYKMGGEVTKGWRLSNIWIGPTNIRVRIKGSKGKRAQFRLVHPERPLESAFRTKSFKVILSIDTLTETGGSRAVQLLIQALKKNDKGKFWRIHRRGTNSPRRLGPIASWLNDGILFLIFLLLLFVTLSVRQLRNEPTWIKIALPVVVILGLCLRLLISRDTAMGAWSFGRIPATTGAVFRGPLLAYLNRIFGGRIYLSELIPVVTLTFAALAPLGLFVHARYLLDDARCALGAAAMLAFLPHHIRFSASEVAFIPSIVVSNAAFVLLHTALTDKSRAFRWAAFILLPLIALKTFTLRPLNLAFLVLFFLVVVYLIHSKKTPFKRGFVMGVILIATGFVFIATVFYGQHSHQVQESINMKLFIDAMKILVSPTSNVFLNPYITPPPLLIAAITGGVILWRTEKRWLALFLSGWFLLFLTCHATAAQPEMQPRYHLHLIVPFLMLAASSLVYLVKWNSKVFVTAALYCALSPVIHLHFERDVAFNDMHEYTFVRSLREKIPQGCHLLEYTGAHWRIHDARFGRMGRYLEKGKLRHRFRVHLTGDKDKPGLLPAMRKLLENRPKCLYVYEGIPCFGDKRLNQSMATACKIIRKTLHLHLIESITFSNRPYDRGLSQGTRPDTSHLTLSLYRVMR